MIYFPPGTGLSVAAGAGAGVGVGVGIGTGAGAQAERETLNMVITTKKQAIIFMDISTVLKRI
jgi:F0F1-type ATP synthase membrane subunit c/vacuolar-type H+-ATPase subunit K